MNEDGPSVYDQALEFLEQGIAVGIIPVETETHEGLFGASHSFEGAPHLKATCYHANAQRRALAAFAMVRFARKTARTDGFQPVP